MKVKKKVMYIDDEIINLKIMESVLGDDYDLTTVENGEKALEVLEENSEIDLVICDMHMPKMNGIEFIILLIIIYIQIQI